MILRLVTVFERGAVLAPGVVALASSAIDVRWPRGEDGSIVLAVVDEAGAPVGLAGGALSLGLRKSPFDLEPALVRAGVIVDAPNGIVAFPLVAADTAALNAGRFLYDVWYVDSGGARHQVVPASVFDLLPAATLAGEGAGEAGPIPPIVSGAVDTVNGPAGTMLSAIDASQLTDGFWIWVRDHEAYFQILVGKDLPVDHDTVETARNLPGGQWVLFTAGGGGTGPRGPQGIPGPPGRDGEDGEDGRPGPPGRDGKDGTPGVQGAPGTPGANGTDGAPGANGRDGVPGQPGPPGRDGEDGEPGIPGPAGRDGDPGPPGQKGDKGDAGATGADGRPGPPGPPGEDGGGDDWARWSYAHPEIEIDTDKLAPIFPGFDCRTNWMQNFYSDPIPWHYASGGGGSWSGEKGAIGLPGILYGDTGANQYASLTVETAGDPTIYLGSGGGRWISEGYFALDALPVTYGYGMSGFIAYQSGDAIGCYFRVDHATNNWQAVCRDGSGANVTAVDTGVPVLITPDAGVTRAYYQRMRVVIAPDASAALFYCGSGKKPVATITTHIPTNVGLRHQPCVYLNDADSTSHKVYFAMARLRFEPLPL